MEENSKKEGLIEKKEPTSYIQFKSRIVSLDDYKKVIEDARNEYKIKVEENIDRKWVREEIPLNLEREYIDELLKNKDFDAAHKVLERMKISYFGGEIENILEAFEYRFKLVKDIENLFEYERLKLKQELNQHNLTTISIVVGVITIFGVANQTLIAKTFQEGMNTFFAIVFAITFLTGIAFMMNNFFYKKKN